ncbi:MAG TPA: phosphonate metabolism protein/1,5-bisphosphokinase (PRPP-forming) PhnN [Gryllotalpicola sp.]
MTAIGPGAFVAVVGASGVGKDALIGYASERLGPLVSVPRRVVTRPAGPGEDHLPTTEDEFAAGLAAGAFACSWRAHGLGYGLPASIDEAVRTDRLALANVSRTALAELEQRYESFRVVLVTASAEVRAERLARRGRESGAEVDRRLSRSDPAPGHAVHLELSNDGELAAAGERLVTFLTDVTRMRGMTEKW